MLTSQEIESKSKEELAEIVKQFYSSPYINVYFAVKKQMDALSEQIEKAQILFDGEDDKFDAFIKFGDKFEKMSNSLENIMSKIDKDILIERQEQQLKAREGSVESFVKNKG